MDSRQVESATERDDAWFASHPMRDWYNNGGRDPWGRTASDFAREFEGQIKRQLITIYGLERLHASSRQESVAVAKYVYIRRCSGFASRFAEDWLTAITCLPADTQIDLDLKRDKINDTKVTEVIDAAEYSIISKGIHVLVS